MGNVDINKLMKNMIDIGRLLWEKNLVSGLNGNISTRMDEKTLLITAHGTCLGFLKESDIIAINLEGEVLDKGSVSTEKLLHTEIYKNFSHIKTVVHTHTTYTNAYYLNNDCFNPRIFEAQMNLGKVEGVKQLTPAVTDVAPVMKALESNNVIALRNHGVVAMGETHLDCFLLIEALEEAIKVEAISRLFANDPQKDDASLLKFVKDEHPGGDKVRLFSQEQIDRIVRHVNEDAKMKELGTQTSMTMDLAVKLDETGQVYSFHFNNGNIDRVGNDEESEFLINAPETVWRSVFRSEVDPFVATTQKKMHLKGDFAKISKWYAPCSRVFELWAKVPIE